MLLIYIPAALILTIIFAVLYIKYRIEAITILLVIGYYLIILYCKILTAILNAINSILDIFY